MELVRADIRDRVLVRQLIAGDSEAFEKLYRSYERRVFSLAMAICGNEDDAADATHEAFISVVKRLFKSTLNIDQFSFGGYLLVAARNASLNIVFKSKRADLTAEVPEFETCVRQIDIDEDPERFVLLNDQRSLVRLANSQLRPRQRQALALRELEGMSYQQIADVLGLKANAVAQLICRSRVKFKEELCSAAVKAARSRACDRALPLLSMSLDEELEGAKRRWLDKHLATCEGCRESLEALQEVSISYRSWMPALPSMELARRILEDEAIAMVPTSAASPGGPARPPAGGAVHKQLAGRPRGSLATLAVSISVLVVSIAGSLGVDRLVGGSLTLGDENAAQSLLMSGASDEASGTLRLVAEGLPMGSASGLATWQDAGGSSAGGFNGIDVGAPDGSGAPAVAPSPGSGPGEAGGERYASPGGLCVSASCTFLKKYGPNLEIFSASSAAAWSDVVKKAGKCRQCPKQKIIYKGNGGGTNGAAILAGLNGLQFNKSPKAVPTAKPASPSKRSDSGRTSGSRQGTTNGSGGGGTGGSGSYPGPVPQLPAGGGDDSSSGEDGSTGSGDGSDDSSRSGSDGDDSRDSSGGGSSSRGSSSGSR